MSDFIAKIRARLDASAAEADLNNLIKPRQVDITVKITNQDALQNLFDQLGKNAQTVGQQAGKAYADGMKTALSAVSGSFGGNISNSFNGATLQFKQFANAAQSAGNSASKAFSQIDAQTKSNNVLSYLSKNTKATKEYGNRLTELAEKMRNATSADQLKDYQKQFANIKSEISMKGLTGRSVFDEIGRGFKQIAQFAGTYGLIMKIPQVLGNMANEVRQVDSAMIELRKVSDASDTELSKSFDAATESARKYGIAISDVISSQADWARLGYDVKDAQKLADATTLLQTVGDNMTQESSASGLISILKGYQMQADEAEKIVDELNQVANTQPIDTSGLVDALQRSASSMSAAGNSLEETIGLITAANSVVQDASVVGTFLKTASMRIRGATTAELEAEGLEADGLAESVSKLREEIMLLSGVDIQLDDSTFKSTYQILKEISEVWDDLTDISRANITELLAGKRGGNAMTAIMQNFDIAESSKKSSLNAEGSAQRELENFQKGIEYSIGQFKAAFQELSTTAISSDFVKDIVDGGTQAIDVLTALIDKFGNLQSVVAVVGGIFAGKKFFEGFDKFKAITDFLNVASSGVPQRSQQLVDLLSSTGSIGNAVKTLQNSKLADPSKVILLRKAFEDLSEEQARAALGMTALSNSTATASSGFTSLGSAIKGALIAHPVLATLAAITALTVALSAVSDAFVVTADEAKASFDEQQASIDDAKSEVESINNELETTQARIAELEAKGSLSIVEQDELSNLREQNSLLERTLELKEAQLKLEAKSGLRETNKLYEEWTTQDLGIFGNGKSNAYSIDGINKYRISAEEAADAVNNIVSGTKELEIVGENIDYITGQSTSRTKLPNSQDLENHKDDINYLIANYENLQRLQNETKYAMSDEGIGTDQLKRLSDYYGDIEDSSQATLNYISDYADIMQNVYDSYSYAESLGITLDSQERDRLNNAQKFLDVYHDLVLDAAQDTQDNLDKMFSFGDLAKNDTLGKLVEQFKSGMTDTELRLSLDSAGVSQYMRQFGVNANEVVSYIKNKALEGSLNADVIRKQLRDAFTKDDYEISFTVGEKANKEFDDFLKGKTEEQIEDFYRYIAENNLFDRLGNLDYSGLTELFAQATANGIEQGIDRFSDVESASDAALEMLGAVQNALASTTGETIGYDVFTGINELFSTEDLQKYNVELQNVNGTLQYNKQALNELAEAKVNETIADNNAIKMQKMLQYKKNTEEIRGLQRATEEYGSDNSSIIASLESANDAIVSQCDAIDVLNMKLRESIGAYADWKNAQNAGSTGDMAKDVRSAMQNINDAFDSSKGESYLRFGEQKYTASVEFLVPDEVSAQGQEAVQKYIKDLGTYFTGDEKGAQKFVSEAIEKGLMEYTYDEDGNKGIQIAADTTMEMFAERMGEHGFTLEAIQAMFGDLQTYFGEDAFQWTDTVADNFGTAVQNMSNRLKADGVKVEIGAELSQMSEEEIQEYIAGLQKAQQELNQEKDQFSGNEGLYEASSQVLSGEIERAKSALEEINKVTIDEGSISSLQEAITGAFETAIGNTIDKLHKIQEEQKSDSNSSNADASSARSESISLRHNASVDASTPEPENTSYEATLTVNADEGFSTIKAVEEAAKFEATATENVNADAAFQTLNAVRAEASKPITQTINVQRVDSGLGSVGFNSLNSGKGRLNGTAHARGSWATKKDETALVGELGTEIMVTKDGKWQTIGDNGAEFRRIPKGSIIFNHLQTEELLKRGFVNGRGSSYLNGTEVVDGTGFNNLFMSGVKPSSPVSTASTVANTSAIKDSTAATKDNTKESKKTETALDRFNKAMKGIQDWISVRIDRLTKAIDLNTQKSENATSLAQKNKQLNKNLDLIGTTDAKLKTKKVTGANGVTTQIARKVVGGERGTLYTDTLRGAVKYQQQADAVLKKATSGNTKILKLKDAQKIVKLIQTGKVNIKDYDEQTQAFISSYSKWFDLSQDCILEAEKLKAQVKDIAQQKLDNIIEQYDSLLYRVDHLSASLDTSIEKMSELGMSNATSLYYAMGNNSKTRLEIEQGRRKTYEAELKNAAEKFGVDSVEYRNAQSELLKIDETIQKIELDQMKWNNAIRQIRWDQFDKLSERVGNVSKETNVLKNLLADEDWFDKDTGKITSAGLATEGLMFQDLETSKEMINYYNDEIKKQQDIVNKNPTDENEYKRLQDLIDKRYEYVESVHDSEQAIKDLVKKGIDAELSSLQKLINQYKKNARAQKQLDDYRDNVEEQTENIATLQKRLQAYSSNDSEEGMARRQQLNKELKDAQKKLEETETDRLLDGTEEILDNLYEEYDKVLNSRLDDVAKLLEEEYGLIDKRSGEIKEALGNVASQYGISLSTAVSDIWNGTDVNTAVDSMISGISSIIADISKAQDDYARKQALSYGADPTPPPEQKTEEQKEEEKKVEAINAVIQEQNSKAEQAAIEKIQAQKDADQFAKERTEWQNKIDKALSKGTPHPKNASKKEADEHGGLWEYLVNNFHVEGDNTVYNALAKALGVSIKDSKKLTKDERSAILKELKAVRNKYGFARGTSYVPRNMTAWTQEEGMEAIIRRSDGSILTPLKTGDAVLTASETQGLINFAKSGALTKFDSGILRNSQTSVDQVFNVQFDLSNVYDYADFVRQAQQDPKFEKFVQNITIGQMMGKSKLSKNQIKF